MTAGSGFTASGARTRGSRLSALGVGAFLALVLGAAALPAGQAPTRRAVSREPGAVSPPARRIVSLVPALTEMLFAIGAGPQVVGISSFDEFPPEVAKLPRVGALLDPDTERILSLRPDLVLVYGSQADQEEQFQRAGIQTFSYRHGGIPVILQSIRDLGAATGQQTGAAKVVSGLQARLDGIRARVSGRPRPTVLLVFERQPKTLREIYASGGAGFLHEMLEIAGGRNAFADVTRESVQPSTETLLSRAPEVIIEVRARGMLEPADAAAERGTWATLSSLPAVRNNRVHILNGPYLVVPGPRLAAAADMLARTLHPDAFK
jgi:iron complex transport system substrate-binding protein